MNPVLASAAGSEFPWYTPILVSLLLVVIAGIYRFRHPHRGDGTGAEAPWNPGIDGDPTSHASPRERDTFSTVLLPRSLP
jgi:hypothetical protein